MKPSIFILAIHVFLAAAQGDPATWAKYDHCPTTPSAGCAYICISAGSDPFCAANDPITPRVYCNACPTTGDTCPATFDESCSYLCADASYPEERRCVKELPEGAPNVLCAGCPGAPAGGGYNPTTTVTVASIVTVTAVSTATTVSTAVSFAISTVTATVSGSATTTTLSIPPVVPPTYNPPGNGTGGNGTLTTGLPQPTYIAGSARVDLTGNSVVGLIGFLGMVFGWYL
ncbi:hypothetical protein TWF281_005922 [Arthrobotrys megalospora]